jgi:hypothetical protein
VVPNKPRAYAGGWNGRRRPRSDGPRTAQEVGATEVIAHGGGATRGPAYGDRWAAANPFEVEREKREEERGRYLDPSLYDAPEEQKVPMLQAASTSPTGEEAE